MHPSIQATNEDALKQHFPGAVPGSVWLKDLKKQAKEFTPDSTIHVVSLCRDEQDMKLFNRINCELEITPFVAHGLAGGVFMGPAAWGAALSHVPPPSPQKGEPEPPRRVMVIALGHVGIHINANGEVEVGHVVREHHRKPTTACGALAALRGGAVPAPDDFELSLLAKMLSGKVKTGSDAPGMDFYTRVWATELAGNILKQTERAVAAAAPATGDWEYAVFTGIQIHVSNGDDWVWSPDEGGLIKGKMTVSRLKL